MQVSFIIAGLPEGENGFTCEMDSVPRDGDMIRLERDFKETEHFVDDVIWEIRTYAGVGVRPSAMVWVYLSVNFKKETV